MQQSIRISSVAYDIAQTLLEVVSSLHTEFFLFVLAIFVYVATTGSPFGATRASKPEKKTTKPLRKDEAVASPSLPLTVARVLAPAGKPAHPGRPSLLHTVIPLLRANVSQDQMLMLLRERLDGLPGEAVSTCLTTLLGNLGRPPATAALMHAVRDYALRDRAVVLHAQFAELLLRGFFALHLHGEFEALLAVFESADLGSGLGCEMITPAAREMALKAALKEADLPVALNRFKGICISRRVDTASHPVAQCTLQQLAKLIGQTHPRTLPDFVEELRDFRLTCETFNTLLSECRRCCDLKSFRKVERMGRDSSVHFNTVTYCLLIEHRVCADDIDRLLDEAMSRGFATKGILEKGADVAADTCDAELADYITRRLPTEPLEIKLHINALRALVRFHACADMNKSRSNSDAAALELYDGYLALVDWSCAETARFIREAALRSGRSDVVERMGGPRNLGGGDHRYHDERDLSSWGHPRLRNI